MLWLYSSCNLSARRRWVVIATPWPLYCGNKQISFVQEAGWSPGPFWTGVDFSPPRSSSFRSELLYRLSYPGPRSQIVGSLMECGWKWSWPDWKTHATDKCMKCPSLNIGSSVEDRHGRLLLCEYSRAVWEEPVSGSEQCDALFSLP
jgi:hypothetical protein